MEADVVIREDKVERRERELLDLEDRLRRKEKDLAFYVGQLQGKSPTPDDQSWWEKQLGTKPAKPAA